MNFLIVIIYDEWRPNTDYNNNNIYIELRCQTVSIII